MDRRAVPHWRRLASGLALLGVLLYGIVLPWHAALRATPAAIPAPTATAAAMPLCIGGDAPTVLGAPGLPAPASSACPICKGTPPHQLAVLPAAEAAPVIYARTAAPLPGPRVDAPGSLTLRPPGRGPPALA